MVKIRLRRVGSRNQASFRILAIDKESSRDGRFLEIIGHYNPRTEPASADVDEARLFHWLKHGALPSDSVRRVLTPLGTWDRWERFKAGEELDTLLEEAKASIIKVDPRTRRDDLMGQRRVKKTEAKEEPPAEKAKPKKTIPKAEKPAPAEEEKIAEPAAAEEPEESAKVMEEPSTEEESIKEEEAETLKAEGEEEKAD